jgi:hypothetical protein
LGVFIRVSLPIMIWHICNIYVIIINNNSVGGSYCSEDNAVVSLFCAVLRFISGSQQTHSSARP